MIFVISILTKISLILFPLENLFCWEFIGRIIGLYSAYQIFIFMTLNQIDDAEKDSYNTLRLLCEESLLYFKVSINNLEYRTDLLLHLIKSIYLQKSSQTMNSEAIIKEYDILLKAIINNDIVIVKQMLIRCNHCLYHLDLQFTKSLLLRKFKNPFFSIKKKILIIFSCLFILGILYFI